jgi:hypothetical protein
MAIVACNEAPKLPPELSALDSGKSTDDAGVDPSCGDDAGPSGGGMFATPKVAPNDDPATCDQAAQWQSYVGCDFWPTVVANNAWSIFDYAVVVANAGTQPANVTVTGPGGTSQAQTVAPNTLAKIYLPWIPELKGPDADSCGKSQPLTGSVLVPGGAYHLVSSVPVTVYQFNALEYEGKGGPAGKDWSSCPGNGPCNTVGDPSYGVAVGCFSFSNDSSLLLPSTAMTGSYRVTGPGGWTARDGMGGSIDLMGSYTAITATMNGTHVKVGLSSAGDILAGQGIAQTSAGGELDLTMNAGDVAELAGSLGDAADQSGSLVTADQPIQVIAGIPCTFKPEGAPACDHLEQSVFPAETLGKHYFVMRPTGPLHTPESAIVRFYGNVDGTMLAYAPTMPPTCPATLSAGQVVDCGQVAQDFEVTGSSEFGVAVFMLGATIVDPVGGLGDPSESLVAAVEQYRTKYVFLAPNDYTRSFIDVVAPTCTTMTLDGQPFTWFSHATIADGYTVYRSRLSDAGDGSHVLEAAAPVGVQVMGYGEFTSYQYPAGLNLKHIAPPPPTK